MARDIGLAFPERGLPAALATAGAWQGRRVPDCQSPPTTAGGAAGPEASLELADATLEALLDVLPIEL